MNKDVRKLVQSISQIEGVEVRNGGKHLTVFKDGKRVTTIAKTPSDHRALANATAELRRAGITPSVRPARMLVMHELISDDEMRTRLLAMPSKAEFARFVIEVQETSGQSAYNGFNSAAVSIANFRNGKTGVSEDARILLDMALRQWDRVRAAKSRIVEVADKAQASVPVVETEVDVPVAIVPHEQVAEAGLTLRVDVAKLSAALAEFGITLKVE